MTRLIALLIAGYLLLLLETSRLTTGWGPAWLWLGLVLVCLRCDGFFRTLAAGWLGFLIDCLHTGPLGAGMFCGLLLTALCPVRPAWERNWPEVIGLTALLTGVGGLMFLTGMSFLGQQSGDWLPVALRTLRIAALNTFWMWPVWSVCRVWDRWWRPAGTELSARHADWNWAAE